ncbi:MAG: hypothetical protein VX346_12120 [Planctomycetota bacterium]|nr:hypothetical protein [Planctomycetota bacterium]
MRPCPRLGLLLTIAISLRADDSGPAVSPQRTTEELRFASQTTRTTCATCHERDGRPVVDPGWHHNRSIYPQDILATLHSTMGIDWSKRVRETLSGRPFDYIENISPKGCLEFDEVKEVFA